MKLNCELYQRQIDLLIEKLENSIDKLEKEEIKHALNYWELEKLRLEYMEYENY